MRGKSPARGLKIRHIDWSKAEYLGRGAYGRVYRVAPGIVVKLGHMREEEAIRQKKFAAMRLAVPVYDFQQDIEVPRQLVAGYCFLHGYDWDQCSCTETRNALLMAEAERPGETRYTYRFMRRFYQLAYEVHDYYWDNHTGNIGRYRGRYVALDFA
jgi:hypothetical protein